MSDAVHTDPEIENEEDDLETSTSGAEIDLPYDRYLDREVSWLAFNQRVLELAEDGSVPLLERANFLAIFASNLDEFFMVRVAGLQRRIVTGLAVPTNVGRSPHQVMSDIAAKAHELQERHARVWRDEVGPQLATAGIEVVSYDKLSDDEQAALTDYFQSKVFPVLMPLAVDPAHPFPYISGLSLNLAIRIRNAKTGRQDFARLKVPPALPRFVTVPGSTPENGRYVPLEDLIAKHLEDLFPGMEIVDHHAFRLTRNEDVEIDEDESENLIQALEQELSRRRFGPPIRLEVADDIDDVTLALLVQELGITEQEVYRLPAPLDLRGLFGLSGIDRPELHYAPHLPVTALPFQPDGGNDPDFFKVISDRDVLVHHPYESFTTSVVSFLQQAARDPHVLAIKQTLYRTSGDSPIVQALIDAADSGKQVLALVEVKARFDEANNINWARKLERAGVHVVYGLVGLKTHTKALLVIREEGGELRSYCHVGTGNYNPKTSRIYEDFGLFTANEQVGKDLTRLFNQLSGYAIEKKYKRLLVAPLHLRKGLLRLIKQERKNALAGKPAHVRIKLNSIVDEQIIDALYEASAAGVQVDVFVRGICSVRTDLPGISDNIRVHCVLGRYLEHSRVFGFHNDGNEIVYIGSADMMHRNLDRRVEALIQLTDPTHIKEVTDFFDLGMSDSTSSWRLGDEGVWERRARDAKGEPLADLQDETMRTIQKRRRTRAVR